MQLIFKETLQICQILFEIFLMNAKHIIFTDRGPTFGEEKNVVRINIKNRNWVKPFYKKFNLEPESQDKVTVEFLLQHYRYVVKIIKNIDILLRVSGELTLILFDNKSHQKSCRSISQVKHSLSMGTNGRYNHISSKNDGLIRVLTYIKKRPTLPRSDSINKWSFGIISNGRKNEWVLDQIKSITDQKINSYEILICGPNPYGNNQSINDKVRIINDIELLDDIRAPVCHKKNSIIKEAKFNNLCIMHDRFILPKKWLLNMKSYGNYFDVLCLKVVNSKNQRILVDWMNFHSPLSSIYKKNNALMYNEWDSEVIIPGGAFIVKKNLIEDFMLDERLYWDEMEDIYFSKVCALNGLLIDIDSTNFFITKEVRQKARSDSWISLKIYSKFFWLKDLILLRFKLFTTKNKYFKNI
jgi:hypothetical protein